MSEENDYSGLLIDLLSADAYWSVNKKLARFVGIEVAVFTSELLYKYKYWRERGQLDADGGFFFTADDIMSLFHVGHKTAARFTKQVQEAAIVDVKKRGVPAKNYWYIQFQVIYKIISQPQIGMTGEPQTVITGEPKKGGAITKKTNKENNTNKDGAFSMLPQRLSGKGKIVKQKDEEAYADFETFCTFWESMTGQDYRKQKPGYYFGARKKYGVEALHAALKGYAGSEWHKEKRAWNLGKFFRDDVYKYMPKKEQDASVWDWAKLPAELAAYKELLQVGDRFGGTWYLTTAENLTASFVEDQFKKHGVSVNITKKAGI